MAGLSMVAKGVSFMGAGRGINFPVTDGLLGVYMGGAGFLRNVVYQGVNSEAIGSPTVINNFTTRLDKDNYIDTKILPGTVESTLFVVTRRFRGAAYSEPFGCWTNSITDGSAILGRGLLLTPNGGLQGILNTYSASANNTVNAQVGISADAAIPNPSAGPDSGVWRAVAQRVSTTMNKVQDLTAGLVATNAFTGDYKPDTRGVESYKIGRPKTSSLDGTGKSDVMLAVLFNRAITDEEMTAVYAYAQKFAAKSTRGITI
ncbi:hypothetical protein [Raoultella terrigena]|uniref:hypothetical protein n=1 Tax=Raoultella terrigena TaxID=577 RepID=UPI00349FC568